MPESELKVNLFLIQYCRILAGDIADERLAEQPLPAVNHPAWILGHLACTAGIGVTRLGGETVFPAEWEPRFIPGSKLSATRDDYPSKEALLGAVEKGFERLRQTVSGASSEQLSQPTTHPRMKAALPTVGDSVAFLLTGHLGLHLGQLSTWRRMIGLPPLF